MKDYKYLIPDIDIKTPTGEIILYMGQIYDIVEIKSVSNGGSWMIKTKNPTFWKLNHDIKLLTEADMRVLKMKKFINKIMK